MKEPRKERGSEVGITLARAGVTVLCNQRALRSLARYLTWLAASPPNEHYHCHVVWEMANHRGKAPGVFLLFDDTLRKAYPRRAGLDPGFELTIMAMPDGKLRSLRPRRGRRGRLAERSVNEGFA
jgi:hypothetical protein